MCTICTLCVFFDIFNDFRGEESYLGVSLNNRITEDVLYTKNSFQLLFSPLVTYDLSLFKFTGTGLS
jgi:hypothetical protein